MTFELVNTATGETVRGGDGELRTFTDAYSAYQFEAGKLAYGEDHFEIKFVPSSDLEDNDGVTFTPSVTA